MKNLLLVAAMSLFLSCLGAIPAISPGELLQQPGGPSPLEPNHEVAIETLIIVDSIVAVVLGGLSYATYRIIKWLLSRSSS